MSKQPIIIIGGGLSGLSLSILLAQHGIDSVILEKGNYPSHKVCGEYISLESWDFLEKLGIPLTQLQLPIIKKLQLSNINNTVINTKLPLGGFGISRYTLDELLYNKAIELGVQVHCNTKVIDIQQTPNESIIKTADNKTYISHIVIGAYGKRSNIDKVLQRDFINQKPNALHNFIGIKYHIQHQHDANTIQMHLFDKGYCGMSKIEDNKSCLCYLTTAANLQKYSTIENLEKEVVSKNKQLRYILENCKKLYDKPLSIAQINFSKKNQNQQNISFLGDSASLIAPISGNGMSIAMHSASILFDAIKQYHHQINSLKNIQDFYSKQWNNKFKNRMSTGRLVQQLILNNTLNKVAFSVLNNSNWLLQQVIKQTHGEPF
jgi:menaquinone-9 beta-reductase